MITEQRHKLILELLKMEGIVKLDQLVEKTGASESTIRRDLTYLESKNYLKRVHGGATLLTGMVIELSHRDKVDKNREEKIAIAKYAASLVNEGECIYLDAGTTTFNMIKYLDKKDIVVVTNGLNHINTLMLNHINSYILGGKVKQRTRAVIGNSAINQLKKFRFDKCFIGTNGIHFKFGYTTPDLEEAAIKEEAIKSSKDSFVLSDSSKFGEVSFIKFAELEKAQIIAYKDNDLEKYKKKTIVKVVSKL